MKNEEQILKIVLVGGVGLLGIVLIAKMINDKRKQNSSKRLMSDDNVRIATELNSAIHTGRNWFTDLVSGADKETIFRLAGEIKNYEDIATEYKNLYNTSLTLELQDALGKDYPEFLKKLGKVIEKEDVISDLEATEIADAMFDDMDGITWFYHNKEPYIKLLRLSDGNFKKVIEIFNAKYGDKEDFKTMFENEFSVSFFQAAYLIPPNVTLDKYSWQDIQAKVIERYKEVYYE